MTTVETISSLPSVIALSLYQGDDFAMSITVSTFAGEPSDLTGSTIEAEIHSAPGANDVLGTFTISVTTNVITLTLPAAVSAVLPLHNVWDCVITYPNGVIRTVALGRLDLSPRVSA